MNNETAISTSDNPSGKIKIGEKIAFCVGEIFGGGGVVLLDAFFFTYATLIVGLNPALVGTIGMVARFWDAFTDPLMGTISDNTRTKLGRRRPYIIASAGLIIVALILLFLPIANIDGQAAKMAYLITMYLIYSTVSTIFNVPYLSLTSEISENVKERSNMNMVRLIVSALAGAVCFLIPDMVVGKINNGLSITQACFIISIGFGLFFAIPTLCSGLFTKERTPLPESKIKFSFKIFANTYKLKCFRRLLGMYVFSFTCNAILTNILIIFCYNVTGGATVKILGLFGLATGVYVVMLVAAGVMMPLVLLMLNKKVPKPVIYMAGIPLFIIGGATFAFFPAQAAQANPYLLLIPAAIAGIGFGLVQSIPWLTFPDVVDVAELKSNDRNPGAYNGTMTFFKKFASGIAVFIIGIALKSAGFDSLLGTKALQPPAAIEGMRYVIGITVPVLLVLGFICAWRIKITTRKSERVRYFIDRQRAGEIDNLNDDEKEELHKLSEELF